MRDVREWDLEKIGQLVTILDKVVLNEERDHLLSLPTKDVFFFFF